MVRLCTRILRTSLFTVVGLLAAQLTSYAQVQDKKPLTGFVDLHTHPLANLGFGGKLVYGGVDVGALLPADPDCQHRVRATSEQQALGHDKSTHGGWDLFSNGCGDEFRKRVIHEVQRGNGGADESEDASGYPSFPEWPVWNDLTHQKMWVEWIRRAYLGGLRAMVALAVNNKTLGDMTAGPGDYPTDDKSSADLQIAEIRSFVGRHPDFMAVAYTSADVYRIVSANKLAVIIGIEVDHIGNLYAPTNPLVPGLVPVPPSNADLKAEIDRLYGEGVRYIFPIHVIDNAFGGSAAYQNLFNVSNYREDGHPYLLVCANTAEDITYRYNNDELGFETIAAQLLKTGFSVNSISYPPCNQPGQSGGQKNSLGLTASGEVALHEMMRLGMLIDVDHMSQAAADATLKIAQQFGYPVNSGHNGLRGTSSTSHNERALRADQYKTIGKLHGMAGVGSAGADAQGWLTGYNLVITAMGGGSIVGAFGTDTDGLALGMRPRPGMRAGPQYPQYQQCISDESQKGIVAATAAPITCRQQFPNAFVTVPPSVRYSSAFPPSRDGNKIWDYNVVGVAHYGMLPDFLQDVKSLPGGAAMVARFMHGADYFYRTWKLAEQASAMVK